MLLWKKLIIFFLLSVNILLFSSCSNRRGYEEGDKAIGFKLPIEGENSEYTFPPKDKKAVFLVFGFPGCFYCRKTIEAMRPYMEEHKNDKNIDFVFVKVLSSEGILTSSDNLYILEGNDHIKKMYNVRKTPTVIIVDSKGIIVDRSIGYEDGQEQKYISILNNLLEKK